MRLSFCVACGTEEGIHHHHLMPKSMGGSDDEDNLIALCPLHHGVIHQTRYDSRHAELTRRGMERARDNGKVIGPIPYGYKRHRDRLIEHPEEKATIEAMKALKSQGKSYGMIARELNLLGKKRRGGKEWNASAVHGLFKRRKEPL